MMTPPRKRPETSDVVPDHPESEDEEDSGRRGRAKKKQRVSKSKVCRLLLRISQQNLFCSSYPKKYIFSIRLSRLTSIESLVGDKSEAFRPVAPHQHGSV